MEIDFSKDELIKFLVFLSASMLGIFGMIGARFTPDDLSLVTWEELQIRSAQQAYRHEILQLKEASIHLEALLEKPQDPIRAQFEYNHVLDLADQISSPATLLFYQELLSCADSVRNWSLGMQDTASARESVFLLKEKLEFEDD